MNWLQFISALIGSLAWPVATVVIVCLLRRAIVRLLPNLRRLKYGDVEAEFGEKLEEAEEEIFGLPAPVSSPAAVGKADLRLAEGNSYSNNSAVFVAWLSVESAILNLARAAKVLVPNMSASRAAENLFKRELVDHGTLHAIRELRDLRNIAVHPGDGGRAITSEEVDRFKKLAEKVSAILEDSRLSVL